MSDNRTVVFESFGPGAAFTGKTDREAVALDRDSGHGMSSVEFLLMSLGSCVIGTLKKYLSSHDIDLGHIVVESSAELVEKTNAYDNLDIRITCSEPLTDRLSKTIYNVAKTCRIHRTLDGGPNIAVTVTGGPEDQTK